MFRKVLQFFTNQGVIDMKLFNKFFTFTISILISIAITKLVLANEDGDCKYSKWGADDEIGEANYVNE